MKGRGFEREKFNNLEEEGERGGRGGRSSSSGTGSSSSSSSRRGEGGQVAGTEERDPFLAEFGGGVGGVDDDAFSSF
jgi:hypothetical protein